MRPGCGSKSPGESPPTYLGAKGEGTCAAAPSLSCSVAISSSITHSSPSVQPSESSARVSTPARPTLGGPLGSTHSKQPLQWSRGSPASAGIGSPRWDLGFCLGCCEDPHDLQWACVSQTPLRRWPLPTRGAGAGGSSWSSRLTC